MVLCKEKEDERYVMLKTCAKSALLVLVQDFGDATVEAEAYRMLNESKKSDIATSRTISILRDIAAIMEAEDSYETKEESGKV